jgi:hypothetical protein
MPRLGKEEEVVLIVKPFGSLKFSLEKGGIMKKRKLKVSRDVKIHLEKMRDVLDFLTLNDEHLSKVVAGDGCGGFCRFTCSYFCKPTCEVQCKDSCDNSCTGGCVQAAVGANCPQYIIWVL